LKETKIILFKLELLNAILCTGWI